MAHILIVDDSATDVSVIKKILDSKGYTVSSASNGEDGIQKAKELQPNLIIMDIIMPGLNGFQATRKIIKNPDTKSIPIVFLSSKDMESDRAWGLMTGAKEYLTKPINSEQLLETVTKIIG
ncbi:MAG: response regulator [Thiomargarita sp.]|nr:response regulator [Thiomargarita sp.]